MSPKTVIMIVLFVVSLAVGAALGEWFFRLYLKAIPPVALSDFNAQSARIAYLVYGVAVGLLLFAWSLIGMAVGRMFQMMSKPAKE